MIDRIELLKLERNIIIQKLNLLEGVLGLYPDVEVLVELVPENREIYVSNKAMPDMKHVEFYWKELRLYAWPFVQLNHVQVHLKRGGIMIGSRERGKSLMLDEILEAFSKEVRSLIYERLYEGEWISQDEYFSHT